MTDAAKYHDDLLNFCAIYEADKHKESWEYDLMTYTTYTVKFVQHMTLPLSEDDSSVCNTKDDIEPEAQD